MTSVSELLYQLYVKTVVIITYMLIQLILLVGYLTSDTRSISTTQFLNLIEEKNPTTQYTMKTEHGDCRVCLSEFQEGEKVRNLNCKHTFHKDCLDHWLQHCATCPLCRNKLLPDHVVSKYYLLHNQVEYNDDHFLFLLSALRGSTSNLHRYL
ncbi:hypothetical protein RJT34_03262 [Clitoria ternatea]|uniref:RING-type domain-containing protein n=1 Tax=Clitoria ternatea TaxID=43366 RepID=A0AAN9Q2D8_CLITE